MELVVWFVKDFLFVYALLLSIYFGLCLALVYFNKRISRKKIQSSNPDKETIKRDILQSAISLCYISVFFAIGDLFHKLNIGFVPYKASITSIVLSSLASLFLFDTWFYWFHRLLHTKMFYKKIHRWHHMSLPPTVWANNSDTFLDTLFLQSYWCFVHFFIPILPAVVLVHKIYDQISGIFGHSGHEYFDGKMAEEFSPLITVTFHDQHHQYFSYNYATHFCIWDRLMGTLHPKYYPKIKELNAQAKE